MLALSAALLTAGLSAPARAVELTTYGYGNARLGAAAGRVGISPGSAPRLHAAWVTSLPGGIDGQPLVVNRVRVGHRRHNLALVGTEHGRVAAVDVGNGRILWERRFGFHGISPSCQASPDGVFGITGTMVADPSAGRVYAVDVNGRAWALQLASGRVLRGWPVRVHPGGADFVWGALTLSRGWLYVPIASLCDRGRYYGGIKAVNVIRPRQVRRWETMWRTQAHGGGIWGWGGVSVDAGTGDVFAATGNALGGRESTFAAERVVRLSAALKFKQSNYPLRPPFPVSDRDFGTAPVLIDARGCQPKLVAINKNGNLYVYNRNNISGGPSQIIRVAVSTSNAIPLYGMPAFDPGTRRLVLVSPTAPPGSSLIAGVQSFVLSHHCRFVQGWQQVFDPPDAGSAPTIAGRVVYIGSGRNGVIHAFRLSDGQQLWSRGLGASIFAAPSVADGTLFVGDWAGRLWGFKPHR